MNADPCLLSAHELSIAYAAKLLSPVDVIDALLARIARLDDKLNAWIDVYGDEARESAIDADKAIRTGKAVGLFHGVPIAIRTSSTSRGRSRPGDRPRA